VQFDRYLAEGVDVLYLGDSTLMLPVGEVTTGEILQELLPDRTIGQVAHPAYGLDLFYDYVAYMDRHGGTAPDAHRPDQHPIVFTRLGYASGLPV
jgi:hypothetical protein